MEREMVNVRDEFNIMRSRETMEIDQGQNSKIDEYLHKFNFYRCS